MQRRWKLVLGIAVGLVLALGLAVVLLYRATQYVPPAYERVMGLDPAAAAAGSDETLRRATNLHNRLRKPGPWEAVFTEDQINGWLAVDLPKNHPDALPPAFKDPRITIEDGRVVLFCRYDEEGRKSVLSLTVEPRLPSPDVVAVRICGARAGSVPLPIDKLLDEFSKAAGRAGIAMQWKQIDGDPVALITLPRSKSHGQVRLEGLHVGQGKIAIRGTTSR